MHMSQNLAAGFPHLYYHSEPEIALRFLEACLRYSRNAEAFLDHPGDRK